MKLYIGGAYQGQEELARAETVVEWLRASGLNRNKQPSEAFQEKEELARVRLVGRTPGTPFYAAFQDALTEETSLGDKARAAWDKLRWWRFLAGSLTVDLTEANIENGATIDADVSFGSMTLRLPATVCVKAENSAAFGGVDCPAGDPNAAIRINLKGDVSFGKIEVEYV